MSKEKDLKYIKGFAKINISQICKDLKINRSNLLNGRASDKNTELIKNEIEKRIDELYEDDRS